MHTRVHTGLGIGPSGNRDSNIQSQRQSEEQIHSQSPRVVPHHEHAEAPPVRGEGVTLAVDDLGGHVLDGAAEGVRL